MNPFSFRGELGRTPYLAASASVFFGQHLAAAGVYTAMAQPLEPDWWFWLIPMRSLIALNHAPPWLLAAGMAVMALAGWLLAALAFRRSRTAGRSGWSASLAIAPVFQIPAILWLASLPPRPSAGATTADAVSDPNLQKLMAVQGILAGASITVMAVAVSTLLFGVYGYGLFIGSPFLIGGITAYLANRRANIGRGPTMLLVVFACFIGSLGLIGLAFEGAVCIVLAAPLVAIMAMLGGLLGHAIAMAPRRRSRMSLMNLAALPAMLGLDHALPPMAHFDSVESVVVAAPPAAVWDAVVHMGPIPEAPPPPFSWGLAYPMRGEIRGQGVGAIRVGVFSTGVAYERVTQWEPNRKLSFIVLSDPPTMRELSPYEHVNAPHVTGYFRTLDARFTITPLANGHTRLTLATRHELDLEPALYWMPFAQWAVHSNKVRVLAHFRDQAEASVAARRTPIS